MKNKCCSTIELYNNSIFVCVKDIIPNGSFYLTPPVRCSMCYAWICVTKTLTDLALSPIGLFQDS